MTIQAHAEHFAGKPVKDYDPATGIMNPVMPRREFQLVEGSSNKFWAIELDGKRHTVQFGRIGTAGQTQTKDFPTEEEAQKSYAKLVAEKVKKGYAPVAAAAATPSKRGSGGAEPAVIYRVSISYDDSEEGTTITERLAAFLDDPGAEQVTGLVLGAWDFQSSTDSSAIVEALVAGRDKLPNLKALFLGDIIGEEQEISWIQQSDVSPLFEAYPRLEHFQVRGGTGLRLGTPRHKKLKSLVIETGGLPAEVVREVCNAKFPALEHLELWLGSANYGGDATAEDLLPILSGRAFPKLRYLGLRDSEIADAIAAVAATAPILRQLRVLDLSLGNLTDEGAAALVASPAVSKLEKLDIHHHFLSKEMVKKFKALGIEVNADDPHEPEKYGDEVYRFIAVSE